MLEMRIYLIDRISTLMLFEHAKLKCCATVAIKITAKGTIIDMAFDSSTSPEKYVFSSDRCLKC